MSIIRLGDQQSVGGRGRVEAAGLFRSSLHQVWAECWVSRLAWPDCVQSSVSTTYQSPQAPRLPGCRQKATYAGVEGGGDNHPSGGGGGGGGGGAVWGWGRGGERPQYLHSVRVQCETERVSVPSSVSPGADTLGSDQYKVTTGCSYYYYNQSVSHANSPVY